MVKFIWRFCHRKLHKWEESLWTYYALDPVLDSNTLGQAAGSSTFILGEIKNEQNIYSISVHYLLLEAAT